MHDLTITAAAAKAHPDPAPVPGVRGAAPAAEPDVPAPIGAEVIRLDDHRPRVARVRRPRPALTRPKRPVAVSIYRPARSPVQSGRARTRQWVIEFEPTSRPEPEPLMGWLGSDDTRKQVRLTFPTKESAVAFAARQGWGYTVYEPQDRVVRPKSYAANFTVPVELLLGADEAIQVAA